MTIDKIGLVIYIIGIVGIIWNRKNIIIVLMSIELMLLGVNISVVMSSIRMDDIVGSIYGILILTVAAGESAIGLGILVVYNRVKGGIKMEEINVMQG